MTTPIKLDDTNWSLAGFILLELDKLNLLDKDQTSFADPLKIISNETGVPVESLLEIINPYIGVSTEPTKILSSEDKELLAQYFGTANSLENRCLSQINEKIEDIDCVVAERAKFDFNKKVKESYSNSKNMDFKEIDESCMKNFRMRRSLVIATKHLIGLIRGTSYCAVDELVQLYGDDTKIIH